MIILVDFDDTIVEENYPYAGAIKPGAKESINAMYNEGNTIIISTCRVGEGQGFAKRFLDDNEIKYHYINQNSPVHEIGYNDSCRKIGADIHIDDKNLGGIPRWSKIYKKVKAHPLYGPTYHTERGNAWSQLESLAWAYADKKPGLEKFILSQYHDLVDRRRYLMSTYQYNQIHYLDVMAVTLLAQLKRYKRCSEDR